MRTLSIDEMRAVSGGTAWLDYRRMDDGSMWGSTGEQAQRERTFAMMSAMITGIGPVNLGSEGGGLGAEISADLQAMDDYDQRMQDAVDWYTAEGAWWDYDSPIGNNDGDIFDKAQEIFTYASVFGYAVGGPAVGMFYAKLADDMGNLDRIESE